MPAVNLCVYVKVIERNPPRQRGGFAILNQALGNGSKNVGSWGILENENSMLTRLAPKHPHSKNLEGSGSQNHGFRG